VLRTQLPKGIKTKTGEQKSPVFFVQNIKKLLFFNKKN
jgi:hypothetical protein